MKNKNKNKVISEKEKNKEFISKRNTKREFFKQKENDIRKKNVEMQKERAIEKVTMLVHINNNSKKYY